MPRLGHNRLDDPPVSISRHLQQAADLLRRALAAKELLLALPDGRRPGYRLAGNIYAACGISIYAPRGYAIIDDASFPIIGDPKKAYDTYLDQLVADAKAAVDEAIRLGVADPNRIGVTGHSHGALMTANLVAPNLFRAGVATSGSYNKTLTPFGFQNERRSVWEASDVYLKVSPFFFADKLKTPLLIMHGAEDANPGTTPLQAHKLYEAIRGNGGTARLVMLPHEPHWYTAMESNEQLVYEMLR